MLAPFILLTLNYKRLVPKLHHVERCWPRGTVLTTYTRFGATDWRGFFSVSPIFARSVLALGRDALWTDRRLRLLTVDKRLVDFRNPVGARSFLLTNSRSQRAFDAALSVLCVRSIPVSIRDRTSATQEAGRERGALSIADGRGPGHAVDVGH